MEKASKEDIRKELSALGSSLPSEGKESPFRLPDGYFDQLPQMVQDKLATGRKVPVSWMPWLSPGRLQLGVVAMIVVAVLSFSLLFLQKGTENGVLFAAGEEESELFFTLYAGLDPFAMYDLVLETDITAEELYFGLEEPYDHPEEEAFMEYLYENVRTFELGAGDYIFPQNDTP
jgi:hypothetical protein